MTILGVVTGDAGSFKLLLHIDRKGAAFRNGVACESEEVVSLGLK